MNISLDGKHAIVCGSTQGIGKACAIELASLGATITLIARNEAALIKAKAELDTHVGQNHHYLVADFSSPDTLKKKLADFIDKHSPVHILINNTGGPAGGPIVDAKLEEFISAFSNHLLCNQILAQAVIPGMKTAGYGRIINIISTSVKQPIPGLGVSNTTRGAVASWAKTLAGEVAPFGITVNNILPGMTKTARLESIITGKAEKLGKSIAQIEKEMIAEIPAGRFADAGELANAVAFLASPAAAYINGINLPVDGGRTACL